MAKIPKKVLNCNTHHACECIGYKLKRYETVLKIINTWASIKSPSWDVVIDIRKITDEALHELR